MNPQTLGSLAALLAFLPLTGLAATGTDYLVYVGTYTGAASKGIYVLRFQSGSGRLVPIGAAAETPNPSFLVVHPNSRFLYAANEGNSADAPGDSVSAFAIDAKTGKLALLNRVSAQGTSPCHLALDHTGRWLAVANYGNGSIALFPVREDGRLGEATFTDRHPGSSVNPERQRGPHAHSVVFSPDNRFLLEADLGQDKIFVYHFDAEKGSVTPNETPFAAVAPGSGVRHLVFHPTRTALFAINELASTLTVFRWDTDAGTLDELRTISTLPSGFTGANTAAELAFHPNGVYLYASNRGNNSIALTQVDPDRLTMSPVACASSLGRGPRHFVIEPEGQYLIAANQETHSVGVFEINIKTGELMPTRRVATIPNPTCIVLVPVAR